MNARLPTGALVSLAATLMLLAGCGSSSSNSSSSGGYRGYGASSGSSGSSGSSASVGGSAAAVQVSAKHSKWGTVLAAGPKKLTVYMFESDTGSSSTCNGACASAWPPVTTSSSASATAGASAAGLGTITRSDGTKQVTYEGHPLYYFQGDKDSGDAYGQGVSSFGSDWYVLAPSGQKVDNS